MTRAPQPSAEAAATLRSLRVAGLLVVPALALFIPEAVATGIDARTVAALFVWLAGIALLSLAASFTPFGARHPRGLARAMTAGLALASLGSFAVTHGDPTAAADALFSIMIGTLLFFRWSPLEAALVAGPAGAGFVLVALRADRALFSVAPLSTALRIVITSYCLTVAGAVILARMRAGLARREAELAALSERLMSLQEDERRRLSRELHDGVGQSITAILSHLWLLDRRLPGDATDLHRQVVETRRLASTTLSEVRELAQLLRPSVLDDYGLGPSLESHLHAFERRHGIPVAFHTRGLPGRLPAPIETAVFHIAQEALANVARHARAKSARVDLEVSGNDLTLSVEDDGVGLDDPAERAPAGLGLIGIRERVRALGGTMSVWSRGGAHLEVVLPLPPTRAT
ncbi:MAG: sensor histidine kinase [Candidatus Binatia bacterium]